MEPDPDSACRPARRGFLRGGCEIWEESARRNGAVGGLSVVESVHAVDEITRKEEVRTMQMQKTIEQRMREAAEFATLNGTPCLPPDELRARLTMFQLCDDSRPCTIGTSRSMKNWIKKHTLVTERCCFHRIANKPCDHSCYEVEKNLTLLNHTSVWRRKVDGELVFLTQPFDNHRDLVARFFGYACKLGLAVIIHFSCSSKFEGVIEVGRAENVKKLPRTTHAFLAVGLHGGYDTYLLGAPLR